jgi:hypothetical protein
MECILELTQDKIDIILDNYLIDSNIISNNKDDKELILVPINFSHLRNETRRIINRNLTENELKFITKYVRKYCILQAKQERLSSLKCFKNNNINNNDMNITLVMAYTDDYTIGNLCKDVSIYLSIYLSIYVYILFIFHLFILNNILLFSY